MAVHMNASLGERQFLPGVFFSAREKNVLRLMRRMEQPCKVFMGYAGWGPGQLEYELEQGIWRVVPATPEQIFSDRQLISGSGLQGRLLGCNCGSCSISSIFRQTRY